MTKPLTAMFVLASLAFAGCAHPLETLSEQEHMARMDASNSNQSISNGAGDGLGKSLSQPQPALTLNFDNH